MQEDSRLEEWHLVQNKSSGQIDGLSLLCDVRKQGGFSSFRLKFVLMLG